MTDNELLAGVIDCLRYAYFRNEAFLHGEDYIKKYSGLIELEFRNSLKQMTENDWEILIKAYIKALTEKEGDDTNEL